MFEKLLERILNDIIGNFVEGIDANKLNIGIWSGKIEIQNIKVKKKLFLEMDLPFIVRNSHIEKLVIVIPWKSLFSSSLQISIETVVALL